MSTHYDPITNRDRSYGSDGLPNDGEGVGAYNHLADTDKIAREANERRFRAEVLADEQNRTKREDEEAEAKRALQAKRKSAARQSDSGVGLALLVVCTGLLIGAIAAWQVASTLVRYHWIETLILGGLAAGAYFASARRVKIFPENVKKQKLLRVFYLCMLGAALLVPPTLAVRSYFFRPSLPLAVEKLGSFFFFNPDDYREFGEEGVTAILKAAKENPRLSKERVYEAVASTGESGVTTVRYAIGQSKDDRVAAILSVPRLGEFAPLAVPELLDCLLFSGNSYERIHAERMLRQLGPAIVPALTNELSSWSDERRGCAAYALALHGEGARPALSALEAGITDRNEMVRQNCLWAISLIGQVDPSTATKVANALRDPFRPARANAVEFFARHPEHFFANYDALVRASHDEENVPLRMSIDSLINSRLISPFFTGPR